MLPPLQAEFHCAVCGALAATLTLDAEGMYEHIHFMGQITERTDGPERDALTDGIIRRDVAAIYAANALWAPFYCPECKAVYCGEHWRVEMTFEDEDGLPGWYDCAHGTCPHGHRRLVDD